MPIDLGSAVMRKMAWRLDPVPEPRVPSAVGDRGVQSVELRDFIVPQPVGPVCGGTGSCEAQVVMVGVVGALGPLRPARMGLRLAKVAVT